MPTQWPVRVQAALRADVLGEAEVREVRRAVLRRSVQQNVARLDVAVQQALLVRGVERRAQLVRDTRHRARRERARDDRLLRLNPSISAVAM